MKKICNELKNIIEKTPISGNIIMYPPLFEDNEKNIDLSLNLGFSGGVNYTFTTSENLWSIELIKNDDLQGLQVYDFSQFEERVNFWRFSSDADQQPLNKEVFNIRNSDLFLFIFNNPISDVLFYTKFDDKDFNPFGLTLMFGSEFIKSVSGFDGNRLSTKLFMADLDINTVHSEFGKTQILSIASIDS